MTEWIDVCAENSLATGEKIQIDVEGTEIVVFNVEGQFYAIEDVCPHDGGEVASGKIIEGNIICPRHGARFCIKTGAVQCPPAYENIATFPVKIEAGRLQLRDARWD